MNLKVLLVLLLILVVVTYLFTRKTDNSAFEVPAPATVIAKEDPIEDIRIVSPSGPSPPNARVPDIIANKSYNYNVTPTDPYDELYGSQDIKDNLRNPERSFGPSIINSGKSNLINSEVATLSKTTLFNPEMVQNGGLFNRVLPNDIDEKQYALA
jgi:hypothetical protein